MVFLKFWDREGQQWRPTSGTFLLEKWIFSHSHACLLSQLFYCNLLVPLFYMYVHIEYFFSTSIHGYAFYGISVAHFNSSLCACMECAELVYMFTCTHEVNEVKSKDPEISPAYGNRTHSRDRCHGSIRGADPFCQRRLPCHKVPPPAVSGLLYKDLCFQNGYYKQKIAPPSVLHGYCVTVYLTLKGLCTHQ